LSPSSSVLLLAKTITHPAARSLCDSWASCCSCRSVSARTNRSQMRCAFARKWKKDRDAVVGELKRHETTTRRHGVRDDVQSCGRQVQRCDVASVALVRVHSNKQRRSSIDLWTDDRIVRHVELGNRTWHRERSQPVIQVKPLRHNVEMYASAVKAFTLPFRSRNATVRVLTDGHTDTLTDWPRHANRFYNLSHAICYSYGTGCWRCWDCSKQPYFHFRCKIWRHHCVSRPWFSLRRGNFWQLVINKGYIAYFSLRMREMAVFPLPV